MRKINTLQIILGLNVVLGFVLMIGGIITGKHGATVIGLIIAAVNAHQLMQRNKNKSNNT